MTLRWVVRHHDGTLQTQLNTLAKQKESFGESELGVTVLSGLDLLA
jgi:hypothetical protein